MKQICRLMVWVVFMLAAVAPAQDDPGKTRIGWICVTVYHATNGDPKAAGTLPAVKPEMAERLRKEERLRFKHYQVLGQDTQALLRSYESWAQPLKPADEVLVRFEAKGRPSKKSLLLDLELWLGRKKIVKTDACLEGKQAMWVLGPEWRGGRLIIAVALAPEP